MDISPHLAAVAEQLRAAQDAPAVHRVARALITEVLPGDDVLWTGVDLTGGRALVERSSGEDARLADGLARHASDHPSIVSYLRPGDDLSPRRVSDVVGRATWRASPACAEVFAATGEVHQLSLVVGLDRRGTGEGWIVTRTHADFTDEEVQLAARLLPLLTVLAQLRPPVPGYHAGRRDGPDLPAVPLTAREVEVLAVVATGLGADAVGRRLGVSTRTVRKHLEHAYAKLGCHDRLLAVDRARQLGLLPTPARAGLGGYSQPPERPAGR